MSAVAPARPPRSPDFRYQNDVERWTRELKDYLDRTVTDALSAVSDAATLRTDLDALQADVDAIDLADYAPVVSPIFTGNPRAPTPSPGDSDTSIATTAFVAAAVAAVDLSAYAPLASPALTGNPTAPTPSPGDNDTSIATTAFVTAALASASGVSVASRKTGDFTASAGTLYPVDTTSAVITATLPASPSQGDRIGFYDAAGTWDTNNLTVDRNGKTLFAATANLTCDVEWGAFMLVYDATRGWALGT